MIHVRLYASLRDRAGRGAVFLHWPEIGALAALREKLAEELPELKDALREVPFLVAVNHTMANEDTPIKDGDEVGLMPPFSGGSRGETAFVSHPVGDVRIQTGDFSVDEEIRRIRAAGKNTGAVCTFLGTARDYSRGRSVEGLFFEHYPGLAEKEMDGIRLEAVRRFGLSGASIVHRTGEVHAGDNIVLIVAASEHRKAAFEACRWCIDQLKSRVPIWKKEITRSGNDWVEPAT